MKLVFDRSILVCSDDDRLPHGEYIVEIQALKDVDADSKPEISLLINVKKEELGDMKIYIETPQQIDALRRYCEMVLDHYAKELARHDMP